MVRRYRDAWIGAGRPDPGEGVAADEPQEHRISGKYRKPNPAPRPAANGSPVPATNSSYVPKEVATMHIRHAIAAGVTAAAIACTAGLVTVPASASTAAAHQRAASSVISCGYWRWPVKTGSDANRYQVSKTVTYTSVGYLHTLGAPTSFTAWAQNHRIKWPEDRTWQIRGVTLVAIKLEDDGDLHLRLRSSTGALMIAEIPQPSCVSSSSLWKTGITAARYYLTNRYWVSLYSWHYIYRSINIQGLGFFDEEHNVTGAAPNDFELHPVTYIHFN